MALSNALPEVWRKVVLAALRKDLVAEMICNKNFKQEVWGMGDTLNILSMGALADAEYDANNITYSDISDAQSQLLIDKQRYVAFKDEDSNKVLTNVQYLGELLTDAGHQIGDYFDGLVMAEYANAGLDSYATGTTDWQVTVTTAANIPQMFASLRRQLRVANAPAGEVYFVAPPEIEEAINIYFGGKAASAKADDVLTNGFAGKYLGVNLFITNNCTTETSSTHGLAGVMGSSIACANDVITDEGIRLEGRIATGHRMLGLGGVKTFRSAISIDVNLNETVIATS